MGAEPAGATLDVVEALSSLCTNGRKLIDASCNEVRIKDERILFERDNGDIAEFVEKR